NCWKLALGPAVRRAHMAHHKRRGVHERLLGGPRAPARTRTAGSWRRARPSGARIWPTTRGAVSMSASKGGPPGDSGVAIDETLPATPTGRTPATPGSPLTPGGRRVDAPPAYSAGDLVAERYRIVRPLGEGG